MKVPQAGKPETKLIAIKETLIAPLRREIVRVEDTSRTNNSTKLGCKRLHDEIRGHAVSIPSKQNSEHNNYVTRRLFFLLNASMINSTIQRKNINMINSNVRRKI